MAVQRDARCRDHIGNRSEPSRLPPLAGSAGGVGRGPAVIALDYSIVNVALPSPEPVAA
jgi:hypothetical protein